MILGSILIFASTGLLSAQSAIIYGAGKPSDDLLGSYYQDTVSLQQWIKCKSYWREPARGAKGWMEQCGELVIFQSADIEDHWPTVWTLNCSLVSAHGYDTQCLGSFVCITDMTQRYYYSTTDGKLFGSSLVDTHLNRNPPVAPADTLEGKPVYLISSMPFGVQRFEDVGIHGWGMYSLDGQWLIEPKYDAPFHFKNGIADVLYYCQKRKLNEKGEFVE